MESCLRGVTKLDCHYFRRTAQKMHPSRSCCGTCGASNHNTTMAASEPQLSSELTRRQSIVLALCAELKPELKSVRKLQLPKRRGYRVANEFSQAKSTEKGYYIGARRTHIRTRLSDLQSL